MNSLVSYGSDDDYDDSSEEKQTDWRGTTSKGRGSSGRQTDANYEEVQMDLSEGSDDSKSEAPARRSRERDSRDRRTEQRERERESKERERGRSSRYDRDRRSTSSKDNNERLEKSSSRDYNYQSRRERDRDRERVERDRKTRRSSSRERRRSRSPRRSDSRHSRSRSRSRDRSRKYPKRFDKRSGSQGREEKIDPQRSILEDEKKNNDNESDRFFMPGITGRFRDQIERRKQLWQKKDINPMGVNKNGQAKKVWETTTFAQDTDGKVANKFKRLMGIKNATETSGQSTDVLRKQEEMFSSMEQQYEVARTATHTMRGVGLGFGSYQR